MVSLIFVHLLYANKPHLIVFIVILVSEETPIKYLQLMRIEKSKTLLEDTNNAIEDIAFQIGYENAGSFRRLFKQEVKLVPAEYRKKFRSGI